MNGGELHLPFPTPALPGEALFSHLGRLLRASGYVFASDFAATVTGKAGRRLSVALPCRLAWLRQHVSGLADFSCEELVELFTAAPLFRPFLVEQRWLAAVKALSGQDSRQARMLLGLARGGGEQTVPHHCPACIEEQAERFGVPFWPLRFVLPYVTACPDHKLVLQPVAPASNVRLAAKYAYFGAPRARETTPVVIANEAQVRLSALTIELHEARLSAIEPEGIAAAYRLRLLQEGLLAGETRVRRSELRRYLGAAWQGLDLPAALRNERWLHDMYLPSGCRRKSPLHHLMFIGAFFANVQDWLHAVSEANTGVDDGSVPLRTGRCAGTRQVQLEHWLETPQESRASDPTWTDAERRLLGAGRPAREIAAASGTSPGAVYRKLRRDSKQARAWATAALKAEAESRGIAAGCDGQARSRKDQRWAKRHEHALTLMEFPPETVKQKRTS